MRSLMNNLEFPAVPVWNSWRSQSAGTPVWLAGLPADTIAELGGI